ncbi:Molybdenum ABC transporter, periplasmic molybdenum-binding protein ModA [Clostridiaceae bacterium JG1575]|nr:Molybdenum ABC transporter, periplasmic molybdenum-binding protein ModA [Clostridiaceae bacterium JG1575]
MNKSFKTRCVALAMTSLLMVGCAPKPYAPGSGSKEKKKITLAAAASLRYSFDDKLIPAFEKANPEYKVEATYDASGKLQKQIEQGLKADVFFSAGKKQMDALIKGGFMKGDSMVDLLENKLVLIVPKNNDTFKEFNDITKGKKVAVGDPASVPAGQYAEQVLTKMNLWKDLKGKASLGTNVTEVLKWVSEGAADCGLVYATDAATSQKIRVVALAPEEALPNKILYPVALTDRYEKDGAKKFLDFLQTKEAKDVFEQYGFSINKK